MTWPRREFFNLQTSLLGKEMDLNLAGKKMA